MVAVLRDRPRGERTVIGNAGRMNAHRRWAGVIVLLVVSCCCQTASADIVRGLGRVIAGILEVPRATLVGTLSGPPIFGTAVGLLGGALSGVQLVVGGVLDVASSVVGIGMKAAPYILPFVF